MAEAGPWEDYATPAAPQAGPWLDYQKAVPQPEQAPWLDYQKAAPPKLTGTTYEGRPVVQYPDGSWAHEKSISIEADGRHMNIPTLFGGKEYTPDQAVAIMRKNKWIDPDTGKPVPTFKSEEEAVAAAQAKEARQQTIGQPQESTFQKLAAPVEAARKYVTPDYPAASKAITDAPKESERLGKMFEDVLQPLGPGPAEGLGKGLGTAAAAARATFGQLSAVIPKGLNDAMGVGTRWLSENVTAPALKSMVPRYTWDEKQGKPVKDTSVTAMDKLIDEIAPDISLMTLFHAGGRLMDPNAAPLFDRSRGTMAPEQQPLPQQPQTPPPATAIPAAAGRAGATPAAAPPMSVADRAAQLEASNAEIRGQLAQQAQPEAPAPVAPTDVAQPVTAQPPPVPPAPTKPLITWDEHLTELKAVERGDKPAFYSAVEDPDALKYAEQSKNLKVYKNVTPDGDFIAAPKTAEGEATAQKLIDLSKQRKDIFAKARDAEDPRLEDWNKKFSETLGYEPELAESIQGISGRGPDELETERLMKYKAQEAALTKTAEPTAEAPPINKFDTPESRAAHAKVSDWAAQEVAKIRAMTPEEKAAYFEKPAEGERGSIQLPTGPELGERWNKITRPVRMWRDTMTHLLDPEIRATRREMVVGKEAGENQAMLTGQVVGNDIAGPLRRTFGKNEDVARQALSIVIEAKGDPNHIPTEWQKILNSPDSLPSWQRKAGESYPFAAAHWQDLNAIARYYGALTDQQILAENNAGIPTSYRPGYVMHKHDIPETPGGAGYLTGAGGDVPSSFMHIREHETFGDMIAAGLDPGTMDAADLLKSRVARGQKMINDRAWQESLKTINDPKTGLPLRGDPVVTTRTDGTKDTKPPPGYHMQQLGYQQMPIHNGYEGLFTALTDPDWFEKQAGRRAFIQSVGTGKSMALLFDTFHLGRVAAWSGWLKLTNLRSPVDLGFGKRGLTLMDYSPQEISDMAAHGEIPQDWTNNLQRELYKTQVLVKRGFNIGRIADATHQEWVRSIPGIGNLNKFIFDQYQRGSMREVASMEWDRLERARPGMTDDQIADYVGWSLNKRFGNLGRQGVLKSRTGQSLARTVMLAPQWNESLIRSELSGVKEFFYDMPRDITQGKTPYAGIMARATVGMAVAQFAANQLINLYTRGTPTWENPEEGWGAKVSAWIPDLMGEGPGFFLHPLSLAGEISHLTMQGLERTGSVYDTLKGMARSRAGTVARPVMTWWTNEDTLGRTLKPGTVWGEMVKSAIPAPIGAQSYTSMAAEQLGIGGGQSFPGQYQKQSLGSLGIKTEGAPSPEQRINRLAKEFNKQAGKEPQGQFFAGDYQPLTQALTVGNKKEAADALDTLLKTKGSDAIIKHYQSWPTHPFSASNALELQFTRSLNFEQRRQYEQARLNRQRIADQAIRQVSQMARRAGNQ